MVPACSASSELAAPSRIAPPHPLLYLCSAYIDHGHIHAYLANGRHQDSFEKYLPLAIAQLAVKTVGISYRNSSNFAVFLAYP